MSYKPTKINIDNKKVEFERYLQNTDKNILFSAPFGWGKSFFLNDFFKNNIDYSVIKINPINYSVASNEDIFRFILIDILDSLMNQLPANESEIITDGLLAQQFIAENGLDLFISILEALPKAGKKVGGFIKHAKSFSEKWEEYKKNNKKILPVLEYLKGKLKQDKYLLFENDFVIPFVNELLLELKNKQNHKQVILLIDDLDRIDPEHIFRIFNILSAAFDNTNDDRVDLNFDKIILVCDLENIKKIFHHKYGSEVDQNGYFNKFYSSSPYYFINSGEFEKFIEDLLDFYKRKTQISVDRSSRKIVDSIYAGEISFIRWVLSFISKSGNLDYRMLLKFEQYLDTTSDFKRLSNLHFEFSNFSFYRPALFFCCMYGGVENFKRKLDNIILFFRVNTKDYSEMDLTVFYLQFIFPVVGNEVFISNSPASIILSNSNSIVNISKDSSIYNGNEEIFKIKFENSTSVGISHKTTEFFYQLKRAVIILDEWGAFK